MRTYIAPLPAATLSKRIYRVYWRMTFLTRRVVRFRNLKTPKGKLAGVLVFSTQLKLRPCVQHMMFSKGFPVKDRRCDHDTCLICYPHTYRPLRVTGW